MFLNVSLMKVHVIVIMISCATRITLIHSNYSAIDVVANDIFRG